MGDDLQERLEKPPRPRLNSQPLATTAWARTLGGLLVGGEKDEEPKDPNDIQQWLILPNGMYRAVSGSVGEIPPGVYEISIIQGNVYFTQEKVVTDALVDLGDSNAMKVIAGIRNFWTKRDIYRKRGQLFKRGVLMWGPPGSGKTATVSFLMKEIMQNGGVVFLVRAPEVLKMGVQVFRTIEPHRPIIVVFEDIEEIVQKYGEKDILSFLDGQHHTENVVSIATTNYPEDLGARIVNRPSRFDEVIMIDMPSEQMRRQYLKHMITDEDNFPLEKAVKDTDRLSIAHIKELVVAVAVLGNDYDETIARLKTMKQHPKSGKANKDTVGFN